MKKNPVTKNPKGIIKALKIVDSTKITINTFDSIFDDIRKAKKGTTKDQEQDLLRSKLIFATSGLDAIIKQLIKDCLGEIVKKDIGSFNELKKYLQKTLKGLMKDNENSYYSYLSSLFCNKNPQGFMINNRKESLTSGSLQSLEGVYRAGASLGIKGEDIIKNLNKEKIKDIFDARNHIIHEMDVDFSKIKKRRQRKVDDINIYVKIILELTNNFIDCTKKKLLEKGNIESEYLLIDNIEDSV